MTSREVLGWRIPRSERNAFVQFVEEKWGCTDSYVRFELESAMREFLDKDGFLYEAEQLLRDYLNSQGISSSSPVLSAKRIDHSDTVQLGYRVNSELKDEFAAFAGQHYDENLGAILARALNSYRDGGRRRRVLEKIHDLVTDGIGPDTTVETDETSDHTSRAAENRSQELARSDGSDENLIDSQSRSDGSDENLIDSQSRSDQNPDTTTRSDESAAVDATAVSEIAGKLGDRFTRTDLVRAIAKTLDGKQATVELYTEAVTSYENVVEHPANEDLFIPKEERAEVTAYSDLDREERVEMLRVSITREALKKQRQDYNVTYTEVQDSFEKKFGDSPSHNYAYTLMEVAAEKSGFTFKKRNGQKRLCVDLQPVQQQIIEEAADHPEVDVDTEGSPEMEQKSPEEIEKPRMST